MLQAENEVMKKIKQVSSNENKAYFIMLTPDNRIESIWLVWIKCDTI